MTEAPEHDPKKETNDLRSIEDILFAHDVVDQFVSGMLPFRPDMKEASLWTGIQMALCWVLNHRFGDNFSANLEKITNMCIEAGYLFYTQTSNGGNGKGPAPIIPGSIIKR